MTDARQRFKAEEIITVPTVPAHHSHGVLFLRGTYDTLLGINAHRLMLTLCDERQGCGDVLTKKKLDAHHRQCRGSSFTCLDCMTHFRGTEYRLHTVC